MANIYTYIKLRLYELVDETCTKNIFEHIIKYMALNVTLTVIVTLIVKHSNIFNQIT